MVCPIDPPAVIIYVARTAVFGIILLLPKATQPLLTHQNILASLSLACMCGVAMRCLRSSSNLAAYGAIHLRKLAIHAKATLLGYTQHSYYYTLLTLTNHSSIE
jgi:hypothetical protein